VPAVSFLHPLTASCWFLRIWQWHKLLSARPKLRIQRLVELGFMAWMRLAVLADNVLRFRLVRAGQAM
jgi:hypothetical protein